MAPPWLLAPLSPPWPISPPAPPDSLVPLAPPWSVINLHSPQDYTPLTSPHPLSLWLHLGRSSTCTLLRTTLLWLHLIPRPSGSTLVGHQPALSSGLHSSDFTSSLVPLAPPWSVINLHSPQDYTPLTSPHPLSLWLHLGRSSTCTLLRTTLLWLHLIPCPSGSTLVGHQPALSSGLHSSDFTSSLVPLAPPWSVINLHSPQDYTPLTSPHPSVPLAPLGSSLPPAPLRPSGSPPAPRSPEPSPWPCGTPSPPWAPLPPAPQLSVTPWCRQPLLHHGSSFRPLHRGLPSWLLSGSCLTPAPSSFHCLHLPGLFCLIPGCHLHPGLR